MLIVVLNLATSSFSSGFLSPAVRASFSLPGLFEPVYVDQRWLVDGAVVNPVPVSVCHALGAEVIIAVNLNTAPPWKNGNGANPAKEAGLFKPMPRWSGTVLRSARVLAIDQMLESKGKKANGVAVGKTATLELVPQQAEILARAAAAGGGRGMGPGGPNSGGGATATRGSSSSRRWSKTRSIITPSAPSGGSPNWA